METAPTVRSVRVQMNADIAKYVADMRLAGAETRKAFSGTELQGLSRQLDTTNRQLVTTNKRLNTTSSEMQKATASFREANSHINVLTRSLVALGPALTPIGAGLVPTIAGLGAGLGAAAAAAGVAALAFHGMGDALKAVDAYALDPSIDNAMRLRQQLQAIGPAGANLVQLLHSIEPQLKAVQAAARQGLFPGVQAGIESLLPLLPQIQQLVARIGSELGDLAAKTGHGLVNDAGLRRFFNYLQSDAAPTMRAFATATGKVASGIASLIVAVAPLTRDFTGGMVHAADAFQRWAAGLDQTQGFRDFLAYVEQSGPQVAHLIAAIADAFVGLARAAAPIGSVTLPLLTQMVELLAKIADSPLGPMILTFASITSAVSLATAAVGRLAAAWGLVGTAAAGAAAKEEAAVVAAGGAGRLGGLAKTGGMLAGSFLLADAASHGTGTRSALESAGAGALLGAAVGSTVPVVGTAVGAGVGAGVGLGLNELRKPSAVQAAFTKRDAQLATLAAKGGDSAAKAAAYVKSLGLSATETADMFPAYTAAVSKATAANKTLSTGTAAASTSVKGLTAQFEAGQLSVKAYTSGLSSLHQQTLAGYNATLDFGEAVQAAAKQAAEGAGKGLNQFTAAGLANGRTLLDLVAKWNSQKKSVKNNVDQYEDARNKLIQLAQQMGATKAQIDKFTATLDKPRKLVIGAQTQEALDAIARVKAEMATLKDKKLTISYYVNQIGGSNKKAAGSAGTQLGNHGDGSADGSTVPKDGRPYADRYPYLLAPGEEVISNRYGQADRNRGLLKAINAGRLADGGTASGPFNYSINTTSYATSKTTSSKTKSSTKAATSKKLTKTQLEQAAAAAKANAELRKLQLTVKALDGNDFKSLRTGLRDLVGKDLRLTGDSLKDLNKASKLVTTSFDSLKTKRDNLESGVTGLFNNSLWSSDDGTSTTSTSGGSVWSQTTLGTPTTTPTAAAAAGGAGSIQYALGQLNTRNNTIDTARDLIAQVEKKGITGDALAELLSGGGMDALRSAAAADTTTDRAYADAYNRAQSGATVLANQVGKDNYGKQLKTLEQDLKAIEKAIKDKTTADKASRQAAAHTTAAKTAQGTAKALDKTAKKAKKR